MISKIASRYLEYISSPKLHKIASSYLYKQANDPTYYKDRDDYIKNGQSGSSMGALDSPQAKNYRAVDYDEWLSNGGVHKRRPVEGGTAPKPPVRPSVQQPVQPTTQPVQTPVNDVNNPDNVPHDTVDVQPTTQPVNDVDNPDNVPHDTVAAQPSVQPSVQQPVQPQTSTASTVPAGVGVNDTQTASTAGQQSSARKRMSDYKNREDYINNGTNGNILGNARGKEYRARLWDARQMFNNVSQTAQDNNIDISNGFTGHIENGKVTNINGHTIR